ncbi:MAG: hypothetical protein ACJAXX_000820 [Roseivirga sp.]
MKLFDFHKIIEALTGYFETKVELMKLDAKEEITGLISKLFVITLLGLFFMIVLLFLSVGAALALSLWLNITYIGFLIVGGLYASLLAILYVNRASILNKITEKQKEEDYLGQIIGKKE